MKLLALYLVVLATYANHFHNDFQFDDAYAIQQNKYVQSLKNIPKFFTDVRTNNSLPTHRSYRPLLMTSLALDYWIASSYNPTVFHVSTFIAYLVLLTLMYFLFVRLFDNHWYALFGCTLFGLHPAMAETVNYIVQRADLYVAESSVAGLTMYIWFPNLRKYGLYLLPVISGLLFKPPAAVFPLLLLAWIFLEEKHFDDKVSGYIYAFSATGVVGCVALFVTHMDAKTFDAGGPRLYNYLITQPAELMTYFRKFFVPTGLSADTDRVAYSSVLDEGAIYGFIFLLLLGIAVWFCMKRKETKLIAFGLLWFVITSLPTSLYPLAEVENDHRMFYPFIGLVIAAVGLIQLIPLDDFLVGIASLILIGCSYGTHQRNAVWHTQESLWKDTIEKSPKNGRALMNYGLTQMSQGKYVIALDYFNRALALYPNYSTLEINLGIVYGAMNKPWEAEQHFGRAIFLAPKDEQPREYYSRWLRENGRASEADAILVKH